MPHRHQTLPMQLSPPLWRKSSLPRYATIPVLSILHTSTQSRPAAAAARRPRTRNRKHAAPEEAKKGDEPADEGADDAADDQTEAHKVSYSFTHEL